MKLLELSWPAERIGEAIAALATKARLPSGTPTAPRSLEGAQATLRFAMLSAERMGLEAELVSLTLREIDEALRSIGPALLPIEGHTRFVALLPRARMVGSDGRVHRVSLRELGDLLSAPLLERHATRGSDAMLAAVPARRREHVRRAIAGAELAAVPLDPVLILRPHPSASVLVHARHAGIVRHAGALVLGQIARSAMVLIAWWLLGRGALAGHFEAGWIAAWALALVTTIPLGALVSSSQGRLAVVAGRVLKSRLLYGALRLDPDAVRHEGAGGLLGRVLESNAVETLATSGSLGAALALIELGFAAWVISTGAGGALALIVLLASVVAVAVLVHRLHARCSRWTDKRLGLTQELVERMVGHRTRLAQEPVRHWHRDEDRMLETYLDASTRLDREGGLLAALVPRAWMLVSVLSLVPALVSGASSTSIAIAIGGALLAFGALGSLSSGLMQLAVASIAWQRVRPLFAAASRPLPAADLDVALMRSDVDPMQPVLEARDVVFRHAKREQTVLSRCSLALRPGERLWIEGASGAGKSTLAAILAGARVPSAGLVLLDGLDRASLGEDGWRERIATVPQFHENHVMSGSFAFNALLGASWPARPAEIEALRLVCEELGLGPLLARMPAGIEQSVGEHGWQLSHGERSRLFLARALLDPRTRAWIFDESFAALDPVTLERCARAVLARAHTAIVIAHA